MINELPNTFDEGYLKQWKESFLKAKLSILMFYFIIINIYALIIFAWGHAAFLLKARTANAFQMSNRKRLLIMMTEIVEQWIADHRRT